MEQTFHALIHADYFIKITKWPIIVSARRLTRAESVHPFSLFLLLAPSDEYNREQTLPRLQRYLPCRSSRIILIISPENVIVRDVVHSRFSLVPPKRDRRSSNSTWNWPNSIRNFLQRKIHAFNSFHGVCLPSSELVKKLRESQT